MTPAAFITRSLPGLSWKNHEGRVVFLKGRVISASWAKLGSGSQWVETDSKIHPLLCLIGDTYTYFCAHCQVTLWEQELMKMQPVRPAGKDQQTCVFCTGPIKPLQPGDKVRLHYRFMPDASWASWWAERWEW